MAARDLKEVFRQYDGNGDGTLSREELKSVLNTIGGDYSDDDIAAVFRAMDRNNDGKVQFDEFVDWLNDDKVAFTDLCSTDAPDAALQRKKKKLQSVLREGLPEGVRAALADEVAITDLFDLDISFTGDGSDEVDIAARLRLLDAKALRSAYEAADLDKNGYLQLEELKLLFFPSGSVSAAESAGLAKMFAQMDKNNDGTIRCGEFVAFLISTKKNISTVATAADKKQIASAFDKADTDKTGSLSLANFQELLGASTEEEKSMVKKAFDAVDIDGNGALSVVEFSRVYGKELLATSKETEVTWIEVSDCDSD